MKKNALGQLWLLNPDWQLENILDWLDKGNFGLLTDQDKMRLSALVLRSINPDLIERANVYLIRLLEGENGNS